MNAGKNIGILFLIGLTAAAGIFFIFSRMYHRDMKALEDFVAAYNKLDTIIAMYPVEGRGSALDMAGEVVADLQAKASLRLSSMIRNETDIMNQTREIAALSGKELEALRALVVFLSRQDLNPGAAKAAESAQLEKAYEAIHRKRTAAYARFWELSGSK